MCVGARETTEREKEIERERDSFELTYRVEISVYDTLVVEILQTMRLHQVTTTDTHAQQSDGKYDTNQLSSVVRDHGLWQHSSVDQLREGAMRGKLKQDHLSLLMLCVPATRDTTN